jgi:glyoxylate/hydroxypyruvate reductase
MQIYIHDVLGESDRDFLYNFCEGDDCWFSRASASEAERRGALHASEVAFGYCPVDWLHDASDLQWMQVPGVGFDQYLPLAAGGTPPFAITNMRGVFKDCVAETCLGGILALNRGIKKLSEWQVTQSWEKDALRPHLRTLRGARVLVLGTGAIGKQFGALVEGLGAEVTYFGKNCPPADIAGEESLDSVLPDMDVVAAFLPDTPRTRNLFDGKRIALLGKEALFVNAGRGSLVNEDALLVALDGGRLRGAVLDVTREEPLPVSSALWSNDKVLLTQHTAGGHRDELHLAIAYFGENLERFRNGLALTNSVDWQKGY